MEREGGDSIDNEGALHVFECNNLQITNRFVIFIINVLGKEGQDDVNCEHAFNAVVQDEEDFVVFWETETG